MPVYGGVWRYGTLSPPFLLLPRRRPLLLLLQRVAAAATAMSAHGWSEGPAWSSLRVHDQSVSMVIVCASSSSSFNLSNHTTQVRTTSRRRRAEEGASGGAKATAAPHIPTIIKQLARSCRFGRCDVAISVVGRGLDTCVSVCCSLLLEHDDDDDDRDSLPRCSSEPAVTATSCPIGSLCIVSVELRHCGQCC